MFKKVLFSVKVLPAYASSVSLDPMVAAQIDFVLTKSKYPMLLFNVMILMALKP